MTPHDSFRKRFYTSLMLMQYHITNNNVQNATKIFLRMGGKKNYQILNNADFK